MDIGEVLHARDLTQYAVEARYPDFGDEPGEDEAMEALGIAEKVLEWARGKLREKGIHCDT